MSPEQWIVLGIAVALVLGVTGNLVAWRKPQHDLDVLRQEYDAKVEALEREYKDRLTQFYAELQFIRAELKDTRLELAETRLRLKDTEQALQREQRRSQRAIEAQHWMRLELRKMNIDLPPLPQELQDEEEMGDININIRRDTFTSQIGRGASVGQTATGKDIEQKKDN